MPVYTFALASHKGGTGTTTAAAAFAWTWGQLGYQVALVDAHPAGSVRLLAEQSPGECPWPNVSVFDLDEYDPHKNLDIDLVVLDSPPLTEPAAASALQQVDGLILSCRADLLSLRTLPAVNAFLQRAEQNAPNLGFLGTLINLFDQEDSNQHRLYAQLLDSQGELVLHPPVAWQESLRDWPMAPGTPLPKGPGAAAYETCANLLLELSGVLDLTSSSIPS